MSSEREVKVVKCSCGDPVCQTYGLDDGLFYQGSGWSKELAEKHAKAYNAFYAKNAPGANPAPLRPTVAVVRMAILDVIETGRSEFDDYKLWASDEDFANSQRLDFCDAIERRIAEIQANVEAGVYAPEKQG